MLFNSIEFSIFLPIVFALYWFVAQKTIKWQNSLLVVASYFFYGWWDWRFLFLIAFSSIVDYIVGLQLENAVEKGKRKFLLMISVTVNLGTLAFFKYFNFFMENFHQAFTFLGYPVENSLFINIMLPVGISFYTFQTLSYSIDVYRGKLKATSDFVSFLAFVSFFPQLVAGPIERATNLLPQFYKKRIFNYKRTTDGMRQILWGSFKKIVIADNCAVLANHIFENYNTLSSSTLLLGAFFFAFQIYGDFSGYSDIAIGVSRLFGFNLMKNFNFPYFSRDIAEFWRKWHISLTTWFRDYVYIPLGGSRNGKWQTIRNIFIIFIVSGFWHGANWTFIVWGILNALYFLPLMILDQNRLHTNNIAEGRYLPNLKEIFQMSKTFALTLIAWIFFRSNTVSQAFEYISLLFTKSIFSVPEVFPKKKILLIIIFIFIEWLQRDKDHALQLEINYKAIRWSIYYAIIWCIITFGGNQQEFIYFQF